MRINSKALSLQEFFILVVAIGILSGLTLNNFFRAIQHTFEREAIIQLQNIHKRVKELESETGRPPCSHMSDRLMINSQLLLHIPDNNYLSYSYIPHDHHYILEVQTSRGWGIRYNSHYPKRGYHCINGPCPSCQEDGENCGN